MSTHLQAAGPNRRVYLVLQNVQAQAQPEVLYAVYLDAPGAIAAPPTAPVGTMNFFDAVAHGTNPGAAGRPTRVYSFDVTDRVKAIGGASAPTIRIAPVGTPAADARPVIGGVSLVVQ
jgi:hypothetical protein